MNCPGNSGICHLDLEAVRGIGGCLLSRQGQYLHGDAKIRLVWKQPLGLSVELWLDLTQYKLLKSIRTPKRSSFKTLWNYDSSRIFPISWEVGCGTGDEMWDTSITLNIRLSKLIYCHSVLNPIEEKIFSSYNPFCANVKRTLKPRRVCVVISDSYMKCKFTKSN